MKTKVLFGLMAVACCLYSCNKSEENQESGELLSGISFLGMAAHAHNLIVLTGEISKEDSSDEMCLIEEGDILADKLALSVITYDSLDAECVESYCNEATDIPIGRYIFTTQKGELIPEVEEALREYSDSLNKTREVLYEVQYRNEGAVSFGITANKEYNGIPAGEELGGLFHIVRYAPPLIFNYETYALNHRRKWQTDNIADWLAMKPLAPPCMTLMIKEEARCSTEGIVFTVTMTLTNGKVLTATTPTVTIVQ